MVALALLELRGVYVQFFWPLVEKLLDLKGMRLSQLGPEKVENLIDVANCGYFLMGLLAFCVLEIGYFAISDLKRTEKGVLWGTIGCRLLISGALVTLTGVILLGYPNGGFTPKASSLYKMFNTFYVLGCLAFGVSIFSLQRSVVKNGFLKALCILGALGWIYFSLVELAYMLDFSRGYIYRRLFHKRWYWTAVFSSVYITWAVCMLPFIALLFNGRHASRLVEDGGADAGERGDGGAGRRVDWSKAAVLLLSLVFIAIPLCVVPFYIRYPHAGETLSHLDHRTNVLVFTSLCALIGGVMAINALYALRPFWKHLDFGRMLRSVKGKLARFKRTRPVADRPPSAPKPEKVPTPIKGRLLELRQLLDAGLVTQAEYERMRARILSEL